MKHTRLYPTACGYARSFASDELMDHCLIQQSIEIMDHCMSSWHILVRTVAEARPSGKQPKLERLLDRATSATRPYDQFIVHDESRLSRDAVALEVIKSSCWGERPVGHAQRRSASASDVDPLVLHQTLTSTLVRCNRSIQSVS